MMNPIQRLRALGQSIWLDNITRDLITTGKLGHYLDEFAVTGLTSNPTIFDNAIGNSTSYDHDIQQKVKAGKRGEDLFFDLALSDLTRAADLFRPIHDATGGVDGWVSLEVSPLLADDAAGTVRAARQLHERAARPNLFVKIPGTPEGIIAIEESIFAGVPINVTLLFSREQYVAAAEAYLRAIERRLTVGLSPRVHSVASVFISHWDKAVMGKVPEGLRDRLGIAVAKQTYQAYRDLLASQRWRKLATAGVPTQRLLWASTGTKDPHNTCGGYTSSTLKIAWWASSALVTSCVSLKHEEHMKGGKYLAIAYGNADEVARAQSHEESQRGDRHMSAGMAAVARLRRVR
jgi:transaldolase